MGETLRPTVVAAKQDLESIGVDTEDNTNLRDAVSYLHFSDKYDKSVNRRTINSAIFFVPVMHYLPSPRLGRKVRIRRERVARRANIKVNYGQPCHPFQ